MVLKFKRIVKEMHTCIKNLYELGIVKYQHSCLVETIRNALSRYGTLGAVAITSYANKKAT